MRPRGNLFAAALQSELFVAMMALSIDARLPWKTHVAKIAQGLGAYSLLGVLIETGHSYFGVVESYQRLLFCPMFVWLRTWFVLTIG